MPYRCVHCSNIYDDGSRETLSGCECGSKFFFYIKPEKAQEILKESEIELTNKEKKQVEEEVREIAGIEDEEIPVFLDFESIKILKPGKYLIDLQKLFSKGKPKIYALEDGKYIVDLRS